MFLKSFFRNKGILGINARNLLYIKPYNPKKAIKLADDKIKTKQFLSARGIPVPKLYSSIKDTEELEKFDFNTLPSSFALKPNMGYGGEGIIPVCETKNGIYITPNGNEVTKREIKPHIRDILDGRFAISNIDDIAFFEQYIISDDRIGKFAYAGLPDIRIVVHNLIPVMAMLRLPTKESNGKANLHQGAVGVGLDIAKGQATYISYKNRIIDNLPGGLGNIKGTKIPFWDEILNIASKIQLVTNLGYLAVDICVDKNTGPVLLEINARAGLGVQIANLAPLRKRLERIEGLKVTNPSKGVRIAKDMFGNTVEKELEHISGKPVLGTQESVEIIQKRNNFRVTAKIDTGRKISVIDEEIAIKAGLLESEDFDDEKSTLKIKFSLKDKRILTVVEVEKILNKDYKMIIGSRDLKEFLIDVGSQQNSQIKDIEKPVLNNQPPILVSKTNFYDIDQQLLNIDGRIKLLYHLRPLNLESEKQKFFQNPDYNPTFEYPQLKFDPVELVYELNKIKIDDDSALGKIFQDKKEEISNKIKLLENIDEEEFSNISTKLYGKPTDQDIQICLSSLSETNVFDTENDLPISTNEAKTIFESVFKKYGLEKWQIKIKENLVSNCVAGKNHSLFLKENAKFSKSYIEALIVHEIETHIITAENGKKQPYEIFNRGLANYLETQEGMAVYNVETILNKPFLKNSKAIIHVIAIREALTKSFSEVYKILKTLNISNETAFRSTVKAKRGFYDSSKPGAFTKDYLYFKGYYDVKKFMENGGDLKDLYIGKFNLSDLEKVKKLPGIRAPEILPDWLI
ncbi:MAG: tyrosine/phenylalanine carboxypeptidase domain-containing protein [Patescibacteria group bacterium]